MLHKRKRKQLSYIFREILAMYGYTEGDYSDNDGQIRMACPVHCGDNPSAFTWSDDYSCWRCYSSECHALYGGGAFHFIVAMEQGDLATAECKAESLINNSKDVIQNNRHNTRLMRNRTTHYTQPIAVEIDKFTYSTYADTRGIPRDIQQRYKIGIYHNICHDRLGFPIFAINGRIIGITLRSLHSNQIPKWIHQPKGYKTSINLYNIHTARTRDGTMIVTEGPIDTLKLVASGISNCVASLGCTLSKEQIELLKEVGTHRVILAYDNDKAGGRGARRAAQLLQSYGVEVLYLQLNTYKDLGEMPTCLIKKKDWQVVPF